MDQMKRRIVSLWLPHWPIERLARQMPSAVPVDRPFALVESGVHGLSVSAVNACAARNGVRTGTALADARAALPELLSRPSEPAHDQRSLLKLARWLGRYGPARNRDGPDGIWIDVTGVAHLFGGEHQLLADLTGRLSGFGITARTGLASTLGAAHALARYATGPTASAIAPPNREHASLAAEHPPLNAERASLDAERSSLNAERSSLNAERDILAALPVEALRLAPDTVVVLKRLGLRRIGQLIDVPRAALERRFHSQRVPKSKTRHLAAGAQAVLMRLDQALGLRPEPLRPLGALPALSVRRTWGEPLISAAALDGEINRLVGELCDALKAQALGVRQLCLTLYRADGTIGHVQAGFSGATCQAPHMMRLVREKMAAVDAGFGIDMVVLDGHGAEPTRASQASLDTQTTELRDDATALLIDRLSNRIGAKSIYSLALHASHIPEHAQWRRPPGQAQQDIAPPAPGTRRPAFLLQPPEPATVMAEVPEGIPKHFTWRRVRHRVVKGQGPERIAPEWWRHLGAGAPEPAASAARDYYRLEDEAGAHFWLFRQGLYQSPDADSTPRWFVHGLFT